jgi:hypothetical protein
LKDKKYEKYHQKNKNSLGLPSLFPVSLPSLPEKFKKRKKKKALFSFRFLLRIRISAPKFLNPLMRSRMSLGRFQILGGSSILPVLGWSRRFHFCPVATKATESQGDASAA